jgi:hypothetical protein
MICSAKPVLTEDFCVIQRKNFQEHAICVKCTLEKRPSIFITYKPIFSSDRMLHKDYYRKGSAGGKNRLSWVSRGLTPRRTDWRSTASRKVTLTLTTTLTLNRVSSVREAVKKGTVGRELEGSRRSESTWARKLKNLHPYKP